MRTRTAGSTAWGLWGGVLGFSLGGFFDGILLHQILQWHHLFSLVPGMADLRVQILWDGVFHAAMYVLAVIALYRLWRVRRLEAAPPGRILGGALIIGFGLWHVVDAIVSHWWLGIHRIRLDSDAPLLWDLGWFAGFGLAPIIIGWLLMRGRDSEPPLQQPGLTLLLLSALAAGSAIWSLQPPEAQTSRDEAFTVVVYRPGIEASTVAASLAAADARLVWADPAMQVVVMATAAPRRWSLYRHGALFVSGAGFPSGCLGWSRI